MKEDFLYYIWQHQYLNKQDLRTATGEPLTVLRPGYRNYDAGPDFLQARLKVGEVEWNGSVEMHLRASDWLRHGHQHDRKYDQVVLHVVWAQDTDIFRTDKTLVPALELQQRVAPELLQGYEQLTQASFEIPCAPFFAVVPDLNKTMMLERALLERVEQKAQHVLALHRATNHDWDATAFRLLCECFGFKINQSGFAKLAQSLPYLVVLKERHELWKLEALLFGQAGFLSGFPENVAKTDAYLSRAATEYQHFSRKYMLAEAALTLKDWNFFRLRPANFPTVRLAQLAALLHVRQHLFASLLDCSTLPDLHNYFSVSPSGYWQQHYLPGKAGSRKMSGIGKNSIQTLVANVAVPLLAAYARAKDNNLLLERALDVLEALPPEDNRLTRLYQEAGYANKTAANSQAILSLHQNYCDTRQCLRCGIGNAILKNKPRNVCHSSISC